MSAMRESIQKDITALRSDGNTVDTSPEVAKRVLVSEAISMIMEMRIANNSITESILTDHYDNVVKWLCDHVMKNVLLGDTIDDAVVNAMKEYRSSKWRYPDDQVEHDCKSIASFVLNDSMCNEADDAKKMTLRQRLGMEPAVPQKTPVTMDPHAWDEYDGARGVRPQLSDRQKSIANKLIDPNNRAISVEPMGTGTPVKKSPSWNDKMAAANKGISTGKLELMPKESIIKELSSEITEMRNTHVKELRKIMEADVGQAEVMIAVKDFSSSLQEMIEKIGRLQNEKLPPLVDNMLYTYGTDSAKGFQVETIASLDRIMDSLMAAREQLNSSVQAMASGTIGEIDMDADFDLDVDVPAPEEAPLGDELGLGDEFGAAELSSPVGREKKESVEVVAMKNKIKQLQEKIELAKKKGKK
jgi:hypothetical protein